jgi:hypothetical protein
MSLLLYIYLKKVTFWDFLVLICVFFSAMPRVFSIICFYRWGKGVLMLYLGKWDIVPKSLEKITYSNICSKLVYFFLAHLTQRVMWAIAITCRPSVSFLKNLLLWNHWANLNQAWPESSLGGSLYCSMTLPTNHHGHHVYK